MTRWTRPLGALTLSLGLAGGLLPDAARAQGPNPNDPQLAEPAAEESKGDPLYGYVATGFLAFGVMFLVCKSARR